MNFLGGQCLRCKRQSVALRPDLWLVELGIETSHRGARCTITNLRQTSSQGLSRIHGLTPALPLFRVLR